MLNKLRDEYKAGHITAKEYDDRIFEIHNGLLEYRSFIEGSYCSSLEITSEGVLCHFNYHGREINMYLDGDDYCAVPAQVLNYGEYEEIETQVVCQVASMLDYDSVILDIGANLGWYALNMKEVSPDFTVHMFEPVPETYRRLRKNISANHKDACHCHNMGLYKENAQMDFYYDMKASGASSIVDLRGDECTKVIKVEMRKLDDFAAEKKIERVDFIKCDVEGSELFVYQGGKETIAKYKPVIFSEMLRKWSAKFQYHPNDVINLLGEIGYNCFVISERKHLRQIACVTEDTVETNYFFLHSTKHKYIIDTLGAGRSL